MKIWAEKDKPEWVWMCSCGSSSHTPHKKEVIAHEQAEEHLDRGICDGDVVVGSTVDHEVMARWVKTSL